MIQIPLISTAISLDELPREFETFYRHDNQVNNNRY